MPEPKKRTYESPLPGLSNLRLEPTPARRPKHSDENQQKSTEPQSNPAEKPDIVQRVIDRIQKI